jgi:hypothetical protein
VGLQQEGLRRDRGPVVLGTCRHHVVLLWPCGRPHGRTVLQKDGGPYVGGLVQWR